MERAEYSPDFLELMDCLPCAPDFEWNWSGLQRGVLSAYIERMKRTGQHAEWHGEGDVWAHTQLVCGELVHLPAYRLLEPRKQQLLALAALLHDIGKIRCTRMEDGILVSPGHAAAGAQDARGLMWRELGLSGTPEAQALRETICLLIRYHTAPLHLLEDDDSHLRARRIAANGSLLPDFTMKMLCLLAEADARGRICSDREEQLEQIELCVELAMEAGCLDGPYEFPSECTRHAYLSGRDVWPGQALYDDTWGEVILMCGLPGTGKDTWIERNHPALPVVCMDDIRQRMGVKPTDNQGRVAQEAREQARGYLRAKQPFIWNATNLTPMLRDKQLRLFEEYHASVRIVYLETEWQENLRRNTGRSRVVPEGVINHMLDNLIPPGADEARHVEWICV